jgi:hypothetical protein
MTSKFRFLIGAGVSLALLLALFTALPLSADINDWRIRPGQGLGPLEIGKPPNDKIAAALGPQVSPGIFRRSGVRVTTLPSDRTIDLIEVFLPFSGKTLKNISLGATKELVLAAYGKDGHWIDDIDGGKLIFNELGLGFVFKKNFVERMATFEWAQLGQDKSAMAAITKELVLLPGSGMSNLLIGIHKGKNIIGAYGASSVVKRSTLRSLSKTGTVFIYPYRGLHVITGGANRTVQAIVAMPPFAGKTQQGIQIGSTLKEVQAAYGEKPIDYFRIRYPDSGIDIAFKGDRVMAMIIYNNVT